MLAGGLLLGLYGTWVICARLPARLDLWTWLASSGWAIGLFAAAGMLIAAGSVTLAVLLTWPVSVRRRAMTAAVVETLLLAPLACWLLLNEIVYATTSQVLGAEALAMAWNNGPEVAEAAWEMGRSYLLGGGAALAVFLVLCCLGLHRSYRRAQAAPPPLRRDPVRRSFLRGGRLNRLTGSLTGGLAVLVGLLAWQFLVSPSHALTVVCRSAPPLRALNLTRALLGRGLEGRASPPAGPPLITEARYQAMIDAAPPPADRPNVVLIILESVPAKALHCYGHPRADVSPHLDRLAAEGTRFEHCLATASFSSYGVVSLATSLYLLRGERYDYFHDVDFPFMSLTRALKLAGYELNLFSSGNESFDNLNHFNPPEDFDTYFSHDTFDMGAPKPDCMRMDDRYAVEAFEGWMANRTDPRPFYCGFYLQSTHFNYEVPGPWNSHYQPTPPLFSNGDGVLHIPPDVLPLLRNQYDNAMRYGDHWVGRIRDALRAAGRLEDTVIVVIGDHGEAFMEHGLARHGVALWEEMIHVPLIVWTGAGVRAAMPEPPRSVVPDSVSAVDVNPMVARLAGVPAHPSWQGVDALDPAYSDRDRPIFSVVQLTRWQEAVCLNRMKYIYDLTDVGGMLFDLATDPGETRDLARQRPQAAAALHQVLADWHTRQLDYYAPSNRPIRRYLGPPERVEPLPEILPVSKPAAVVTR